jgi:hypothetical protein
MFPSISSVGAIVYFDRGLDEQATGLRALLEQVLSLIQISAADVQAGLFRAPSRQGKWRKKLWAAFDEAMSEEDVRVLNLLVGTPLDVRFTAKIQLRRDLVSAISWPLHASFACETQTWPAQRVGDAGRAFLEGMTSLCTLLSGGVFQAPTLGQAMHEMHTGYSLSQEPKAFQDRIGVDMRLDNYWTMARRLYPITLLGPKLASQVTAAEARAAGALAVKEINGSLLIDAYPTVVETWDPEFLKATVELRRWLWPHTIQNPADAVGLGLKLPKR